MANIENNSIDNDYRSAPRTPGAAHDEQAIGRMNLNEDRVSVVHSGETDSSPAREAQEAYSDDEPAGGADVMMERNRANPTDHNPGADQITAMDVPQEEPSGDIDEIPMEAQTGNPENPTNAGTTEKEDDDNDFEYQQQLGEQSGPSPDGDIAVGREEVA